MSANRYARTRSLRWPLYPVRLCHTPVQGPGAAEEIARAVLFLVGEEAGFITGSTLSVNGGQHMY